MRLVFRLYVLFIGLLTLPEARAQSTSTVLTLPLDEALPDEFWRFQVGHNPAWASPAYNDKQWINSTPTQLLAQQNQTLEQQVQQRTAALEESLDELHRTQDQLIQREKLASLGELTAGIAPEIQNPLNFVNNFSQVSVELLEELRQEATKASRDRDLVDELLGDLAQNLHESASTEVGLRPLSVACWSTPELALVNAIPLT